jgi:hypothetical protein
MDSSMIRIVCAVLAVLFLGLIVLRRKKSAESMNAPVNKRAPSS